MNTTATTAFPTKDTSRRSAATTFFAFHHGLTLLRELIAGQRICTRKESSGL